MTTRTGELSVQRRGVGAAGRGPAPVPRQVARAHRHRHPLPPALRRPVGHRGGPGHLPAAQPADLAHPPLPRGPRLPRGRDADPAPDPRRGDWPARSSPTTTRSTSTCTCGSRRSSTSSASSSAASRRSTRSAGCSATRGSRPGTTPSSRCSSCTRPTATTTCTWQLTEELVAHLARELCGTTELTYQDRPLDLTPPWRRATMSDLVEERIGVRRRRRHADRASCAPLCDEHGVPWKPDQGPGQAAARAVREDDRGLAVGPGVRHRLPGRGLAAVPPPPRGARPGRAVRGDRRSAASSATASAS